MNPIDYHKNKLKELHKEMYILNVRKKTIAEFIKQEVKEIESLIEPTIKTINPNSYLISRDRDLCVDFIIKNNRVTSRQIIDHLNDQLEGQTVRWKNKLDGNQFYGYMGLKLLELSNIKREADPNNSKINYWEII